MWHHWQKYRPALRGLLIYISYILILYIVRRITKIINGQTFIIVQPRKIKIEN